MVFSFFFSLEGLTQRKDTHANTTPAKMEMSMAEMREIARQLKIQTGVC